MNSNIIGKIGPLALLYLIVRIAMPVGLSTSTIACPPFATNVYQAFRTVNAAAALCRPDNEIASVGLVGLPSEPEAVLILDMGVDNQIADESGIDFYYY